MKKIGIMTFHRAFNCGAVLQAAALQRAVANLGAEAKIFDYEPYGRRPRVRLSFVSFRHFIKSVLNFLWSIPTEDVKRYRFARFRKNYLLMTRLFRTTKEIPIADFDCFITGSDQVWNPHIIKNISNDSAYFLDFVNIPKKRAAYAPSFGVTELPDESTTRYAAEIGQFRHLSVRDSTGVNIIKSLVAKEVPIVVDPTLLLQSSEYAELESNRLINTPYVCCFSVGWISNETQKIAKEIAECLHLKLVYICTSVNSRLHLPSGCRVAVSPDRFLSYIKHADFVVASSFHATIFSMIYKRPFVVSIESDRAQRMIDLLHDFGLENRLMWSDKSPGTVVQQKIDFELVEKKIAEQREKSLDYLRKILS